MFLRMDILSRITKLHAWLSYVKKYSDQVFGNRPFLQIFSAWTLIHLLTCMNTCTEFVTILFIIWACMD